MGSLPGGVLCNLHAHKETEVVTEACHEGCAWGDAVRVKRVWVHSLSLPLSLRSVLQQGSDTPHQWVSGLAVGRYASL